MSRLHRVRGKLPRASSTAAFVSSLVVLGAAGDASAQGIVFNLPGLGPTSYSFTNTTLATYRANNLDQNLYDDNFVALTERFDSALSAAPWRLQLRIDAFVPMFNFNGPSHLGSRAVPGDADAWPLPTGPYHGCTPPYCTDYLRPDLRVERISLRYQRNGVTVEAGDVYTVIGRGVAVAFRKVDPLGLDTALRGGRAEIDLERFTFRAFGGYVNPQNLDPITLQVNHDWGNAVAGGQSTLRRGPDILGGAEAAARIGPDEDVEVGVHALRLHASDSTGNDYDVDVYGARAQAPSLLDGALSLHLEADGLRRQTTYYRVTRTMDGTMERGGESREQVTYGHAVFGALQYQHGNWNVLAEWKDYTNYLLSPSGGSGDPRRIYSAAPSLERDDMQLRTNSNARGGRARFEYAFRPGPWSASLTAVGNGVSEFNEFDPWDGSHGAYGIAHAYVTVRRRSRITPSGGESTAGAVGAGGIAGSAARVSAGDWQLITSAGYRHEWLLGEPHMLAGGRGTDATDWQIWHADVDIAFSVAAQDSLDLRVDIQANRRWNTSPNPLAPDEYYWYSRSGVALTWAHGERWTFAAFARYDTFYAAQGKTIVITDPAGNPIPVAGVTPFTPQTSGYPSIYPGGEIRWMFFPGSTLRLFGGMTPGGRLCTGGVCRDVPPFQGALLELVLRI